jgi:hypothetical protein
MSNQDFSTLTKGQVPTYYRVYDDPDSRGAQIEYWWFYGFQAACNEGCFICKKDDGAHHGDWEHIIVATTADGTAIAAVSYFFHGKSYTRQVGSFESVGERPVVYVGREAHGSYHGQECSGLWYHLPWHCCEFADFRFNYGGTIWYNAGDNLVDLDGNSESWMAADRIGSQYSHEGQTYTITDWRWGPWHDFCYSWASGGCIDWGHNFACGTHPTVDSQGWHVDACGGIGCNGARDSRCDYNCYDYDQGWPWDIWWAFNQSWAHPQYYSTIQTGDINGDGTAELQGKNTDFLEAWRYDDATGWTQLPNGPPWDDEWGWGLQQYYGTIQTGDINGDGRDELLARNPHYLEAWRFDDVTGWTQLPNGPAWGDGVGWLYPQYYGTIQTGDISGDGGAELLGMDSSKVQAWRYHDLTGWKYIHGPYPKDSRLHLPLVLRAH